VAIHGQQQRHQISLHRNWLEGFAVMAFQGIQVNLISCQSGWSQILKEMGVRLVLVFGEIVKISFSMMTANVKSTEQTAINFKRFWF
jgi:hypothetical protein